MSLVSYLPPLLPSPQFSTDRNLTVANLHVLATQINIAVLISFVWIEESPAPLLLFHSWNPLGIQYCPVPLEQGLPLPGMHEPVHLLCGHPDSECSAPPGSSFSRCSPPPHLTPGALMGLPGLGSDAILEQLQKESAISCLIRSLFPCPNTHAGWPLLPSVTLPCSAGAGVGVCNLLCITCTVSLSYLSTGCFS